MAVIEGIPGLEVTVEVDGVTAEEYDDPDERSDEPSNDDFQIIATGQVNHSNLSLAVQPKPRIVKYIEAKPGAAFQFRCKRMSDFNFVSEGIFFRAEVDGFSDRYGYTSYQNKGPSWETAVSCFYSGSSETEQRSHFFKFGNLELDMENLNSNGLKSQMEQASKWGILRVKCHHVKAGIPKTRGMVCKGPAPPNLQKIKIAEKALKGKALDSLTEYNSRPISQFFESGQPVYHDPKGRPFAVFEFRYRSMDGLIQEGIVPRPPTPTPAEAVRQMSEEEVRRLAEHFLERERAEAALKNETGVESKRGIKREGSPIDDATFSSRYKFQRLENGKTQVDLTDD